MLDVHIVHSVDSNVYLESAGGLLVNGHKRIAL